MQLIVFLVDNDNFEAIGDLEHVTSIIWPETYRGYSVDFELWAPINERNKELIKKNNIIWAGGQIAYIIESVRSIVNEDGSKSFDVKGRSLEKFLEDRIVWGTINVTTQMKASTLMYNIVNAQVVNPDIESRILPWVECDTDAMIGGNINGYQKTGGSVYQAVYDIADAHGLGFLMLFKPKEKKIVFSVYQGVDRSVGNQEGNDPVVFSTDLEDILKSEYYFSNEDLKTLAFVHGEIKENEVRAHVIAGDENTSGYDRHELYVDARDLQSEVQNGSIVTHLTEQEYEAILTTRGNEKLSDCVAIENFESTIRQFGTVQYKYGIDYNKGDIVTVIDEALGVMANVVVMGTEEDYGDKHEFILKFGYSLPKLVDKIKRIINK